jgi:hypothetical protein
VLTLGLFVYTNFKGRQGTSENLRFPADVLPLRYHKLFNFVNILPQVKVFIKEDWRDNRLESKQPYTTPPQSVFWIIDKKLETLHSDAPRLKTQKLFTCDGTRFKVMQLDATDASDGNWYHHTLVPVGSSTVWTREWGQGQNSMFRSLYPYGKRTQ